MKSAKQAISIMRTAAHLSRLAVIMTLVTAGIPVSLKADNVMSGRQLMDEVYRRHQQFPYVYEEQVMILVNAAGERDTRKLRRYSRMETDGKARNLLVFDDPPEVRGVGLLSVRDTRGEITTELYLPAYGKQLIPTVSHDGSGNFLGTDFSVADLIPEILDEYRYRRIDDSLINDVPYYVVDVHANDDDEGMQIRRHFIRQDIFYIVRTDTFDHQGRLHKRKTRHDLNALGDTLWRANILRIADHKTGHESLIKINRRVFSRDYVPIELFTLEWLVENRRFEPPVEGADSGSRQRPGKLDDTPVVLTGQGPE